MTNVVWFVALLLLVLSVIDHRSNAAFSSSSSTTTPKDVDVSPDTNVNVSSSSVAALGGLAIASRIKASSSTGACQVTVLEKQDEVGGRCGSFDVTIPGKGTFRHERGPSLLLLPHVYHELFQECGASASEYGLQIKPCVPAYQVIFDDGDCIQVGFRREKRMGKEKKKKGAISYYSTEEELESRSKMDSYETDGAIKWDAYMQACEAFLDCGLPNFIEQRFDVASFPAFLREVLTDFGKAWPLKPHSDVLDAMFTSNKMKALASFQDLYVGLEPFRNNNLLGGGVFDSTAPAVFGLLAAIELHPSNDKCGVFAPVGGFRAVSQALEKLAMDVGVNIKCGMTVTKVTAEGVYCRDTSAGAAKPKFEAADLVIVNADLPYAIKSLIPDSIQPNTVRYDWDDKFRFSSGVIAFHWSVDKPLVDLNTHNVFMAASSRSDAVQSWRVLRKEQRSLPFLSVDGPFNFYVHRASKTDHTAAPEGCDSILVLVPCPTLRRNQSLSELERDETIRAYKTQFDDELVSSVREAVLERLAVIESLKDLRSHILHETVDTPATYADQYNVGAGTPFALSHGFAQLSLARPGPKSSELPNVLFAGASSRPGNGVPLVLLGAKLVARQALSKLKSL